MVWENKIVGYASVYFRKNSKISLHFLSDRIPCHYHYQLVPKFLCLGQEMDMTWMKLPQYLKEGIGLYFLDLVGQGRSAKPDIEYTISVQEDVIGELTEALGLEDVSLVGNSYGGWVAMRYSLDRKQPTHLVLEDNRDFSTSLDVRYGSI